MTTQTTTEQPPNAQQHPERASFVDILVKKVREKAVAWTFETFADGKVSRIEAFKLVPILITAAFEAWEEYSNAEGEKSS